MSNDPPKPPKGATDKPGLATRSPRTVVDAIPTEAEGDALFDELFGALEEELDDPITSEGDRPTHEQLISADPGQREAVGAPAEAPIAFDEPFREPELDEAGEELFDDEVVGDEPGDGARIDDSGIDDSGIDDSAFDDSAFDERGFDEATRRPPSGSSVPPSHEPTLGEVAAMGEAESHYHGAPPPDFEDSGEYDVDTELPVPERAGGDPSSDFPEGALSEDEPYAEPYDVPPVESDLEPPPNDQTRPLPSVIPAPAERHGYERGVDELPLEGLGEPAPSHEEIQLPRPAAPGGDALDFDEPLEALSVEDAELEEESVELDPEDAPLEMEEVLDGRDRTDSIIPSVVSERAPRGERLSIDDLAQIPAAQAEIAVDESVAFVEEGEGLDAVVSLMQQGQRDAWVDRASWLYEEAPPAAQPRERARALLVVSELFAMAGEDERAEATAREALELQPNMPLAHRQHRGVLMALGRWTETVDALDAETRVAATAATKLHASYLAAEVARLALGDPDGAHRRLEEAERADPADLRVGLSRLMESLAADDIVPSEPPAPFRDAIDVIRAMRSDGGEGQAGDSPHAMVLRARNALRRRDMTPVVAGLRVLERDPAFGAGAAWLIAAIGAAQAGLREESLSALSRVASGSHRLLAERARAARTIELGDPERVIELATQADDAASSEASGSILSPAERVTLLALSGSAEAALGWLDELAGTDEAAIGAAVRGAHSPAEAAAGLEGQDALALGRLLAVESAGALPTDGEAARGLGAALRARAEALLEGDESHGPARAVLLEHAHASGDAERVADLLGGEAVSHDRAMFAALLAETADDRARMAECLESALADAPGDMAATRMSMTVADTVSAANSLVRFADVAPDHVQAAIALTEAGLRLMEEEGQEADGEALLRRAAEQYPELPVAPFIGMYIAQALEDAAGEDFWLEQRKALSSDPADYVPDMVRRALRLPPGEEAARASLLEESHRARPDDYGLRDLYEQVVGMATDRAAWLMERVEAGGPDAKTAALEAALAAELDGDLARAATANAKAHELGDRRLALVFADRYARLGHGIERVVTQLEAEAASEEDSERRAEQWLRLAAIASTHDTDRALEALRSALAERPDHLPTLHAISALCRREGITEGFGGVALAIARHVDGPDGAAHAALSARLLTQGGKWEDTLEAVKIACTQERPSLWALRQLEAHARHRGDHATAAAIERELSEMAANLRDQATLLLRAAESTLATGDEEGAAELLAAVLERVPQHPVALLERASQLERLGAPAEAARAWEELASICQAPQERVAKLFKAATTWLGIDGPEARGEGRRLLEAVSAIDAGHADTFERLSAIYLAEGAKRDLADLLAKRLEQVDDPEERIELEVLRGKMLVEAGSAAEAREALRAALEARPDNPEALSAYADVCAAEEDWEGVEQATIRLGRLIADPEEQVRIHMRLGELYAKHLPNLDRAEAAYESVLGKQPEHLEARRRLVSLYLERGETAKAFEQQEQIIAAAKTPTAECEATVRLAEIHAAGGDGKQAEQILMKARRQWSKEPSPVAALYRFYQQSGQDQAADMLLERAAADVRRGLAAGRFEAPLFAMAQMVAEMRGQHDTAHIAQATLSAIRGRSAYIEGAGLGAGSASLDDDVAPELFTLSLRNLLRRTGTIMDAAAPFELASLRARPLTPDQGSIFEEAQELAAGYGLPDIQLYATNALGRVCIPAQTSPPTLCFGLAMVTADEERVRTFLVHRALKVLQTGTAALSRTAPIDLWPLFAAYLKVHSPSFNPQGVDAQKVAAFHARMTEVGVAADPQLSLLATEVIGSIGNRASGLNAAANAWGSRTALLALGDPGLALMAVAWAAGASSGPPDSGPERLRWIGRQAEARDLIVFSVSDGYAKARAQLGVTPPVGGPSGAGEALDDDDFIIDIE